MTDDTYGVWLFLEVKGKDAIATVSKWIELPFVPQIGLSINLDNDEIEWFDIERLEYNIEDGGFWAFETRSMDYECCCVPEEECCTFKEKTYIERGWEIDKVYRGNERFDFQMEPWMFPKTDADDIERKDGDK